MLIYSITFRRSEKTIAAARNMNMQIDGELGKNLYIK